MQNTMESFVDFKRWMTIGLVAASVGALCAVPGWAQPQRQTRDDDGHQYGVATHRKGFRLVDPRGQQVGDNYTQYRFVVPSFGQVGTFYTYKNTQYYTPYQAQQPAGRPLPVQSPEALEFGQFKHHDQLAVRLVALTKDLCLDLHHNYQENQGFDETYGEAYQLLQTARFLHGKEHQGDHQAMQRVLPELDGLFHHVQADIQSWRSMDRRNVGQLSLPAKMEEMEAVIHHLMFDMGVKPAHDHEHGEGQGPNSPPDDEPPAPRKPRLPNPRP